MRCLCVCAGPATERETNGPAHAAQPTDSRRQRQAGQPAQMSGARKQGGAQRSGRCRRRKTAQKQGHNRYCKGQKQHIHDSTTASTPAGTLHSPAGVSRLLRRTLDAGGGADGSFLTRPPPANRLPGPAAPASHWPPWRRCAAAPLFPPGRPFTARSSHAAGRSSTPPDYRTPRSQPAPMPTTGSPAGATKPPDTQTTRQNQPAPLMPSLVKC